MESKKSKPQSYIVLMREKNGPAEGRVGSTVNSPRLWVDADKNPNMTWPVIHHVGAILTQ